MLASYSSNHYHHETLYLRLIRPIAIAGLLLLTAIHVLDRAAWTTAVSKTTGPASDLAASPHYDLPHKQASSMTGTSAPPLTAVLADNKRDFLQALHGDAPLDHWVIVMGE